MIRERKQRDDLRRQLVTEKETMKSRVSITTLMYVKYVVLLPHALIDRAISNTRKQNKAEVEGHQA